LPIWPVDVLQKLPIKLTLFSLQDLSRFLPWDHHSVIAKKAGDRRPDGKPPRSYIRRTTSRPTNSVIIVSPMSTNRSFSSHTWCRPILYKFRAPSTCRHICTPLSTKYDLTDGSFNYYLTHRTCRAGARPWVFRHCAAPLLGEAHSHCTARTDVRAT
jgi:hypothetical protein